MRAMIVGYGPSIESRGAFHAKNMALAKGVELVAICDRNEEANRRAANDFPGVPRFPDFARALREARPELVVICTPHESHCDLAVESMRGGAHVAVEKPMTLTVAQADAMIAESRRQRRILTVLHNRRWDPEYVVVKHHVRSGVFGKVFSIDSTMDQLIRPASWRADPARGGGHIYDWGPHLVDQMVDLLGEGPQWVVAYANNLGWNCGVDTWARLHMGFADERLVTVQVASNAWAKRPRFHVCGEMGGLIVSGKRFVLTARSGSVEDQVPWQPPPNFWDHLRRVAAGEEELWVKPEQARITTRVLEGAVESVRKGSKQVWFNGSGRKD